MTKIANMTPKIPRGKIIGKVTGGPPLTEAEHFWKCEACGGQFDMRSRRGARSRGAVAASGVRSSTVDHARQGPGGIAERAVHRGGGIGARD
jgi:hypothetical protein